MDPIPGIDLGKLDEIAASAYRKMVQGRISDILRGLLVQAHNLKTKADRLRTEAAQADAQLVITQDRITRMKNNDWSAIEPFELKDQAQKGDDKQEKSENK